MAASYHCVWPERLILANLWACIRQDKPVPDASDFFVFIGVRPASFAVLAHHDRHPIVFVAIRHPMVIHSIAHWAVLLARFCRQLGLHFRHRIALAKLHHWVASFD